MRQIVKIILSAKSFVLYSPRPACGERVRVRGQSAKTFGSYYILGMTAIVLAGLTVSWAAPEPRNLSDEVLELLQQGYQKLSQSKFEAAQQEYEKVIRIDFDNPFANNNLAVIMEKQGRLVDAMTYLTIGEKMAGHYLNEVKTAHLFGNVCAAVEPEPTTSEPSRILQVIAENKKKLAEKTDPTPLGTPRKSE